MEMKPIKSDVGMSLKFVSLKEVINKPISGEWGDGEGDINVIRTTNFTNDGKLDLDEVVQRNIDSKKIEQKQLVFGDTIIEKSGGSPSQPVGRVVYFDQQNGVYLCNNFTSVIRSKPEIDGRYLFWFLFNNHLIKNTLKYQNKTTGIINLQLDRYIEELQIPLPPLATQKRIAEILDAADALRRKDQELLKKYDELAQAIFIDMFGDPVKNEKGWEKFPVINYCNCIVPGRDKPKSFTGDIPWVTTEDLFHLSKTSHSKKKIGLSKDEIELVKAKLIPKDSVIMTCVGDLGVVSTNTQEIVINQQLHAFQCNSNLTPTFLMYNLSYQKDYMYKMSSSTTVPYMNKTVCNSIPIICPPIDLQNQFDDKINLITEQKDKISNILSFQLFQTLIQKAFKGELVG
jgi:type I restriction enzyme S subunit